MAAVWAGTNERTGKRVALKVILQSLATTREAQGLFQSEALAASRVNHPNVVTVFDVIEHEGMACIVMELLDGEPLGSYIARKRFLSVSEATALLLPAMRGVAAAHAQGVIHRDLKPQNLFICISGDDTVRRAPPGKGERLRQWRLECWLGIADAPASSRDDASGFEALVAQSAILWRKITVHAAWSAGVGGGGAGCRAGFRRVDGHAKCRSGGMAWSSTGRQCRAASQRIRPAAALYCRGANHDRRSGGSSGPSAGSAISAWSKVTCNPRTQQAFGPRSRRSGSQHAQSLTSGGA